MNEVHSQSVNPEYDRLLERTAQAIGMDVTELHNKLQNAWLYDRINGIHRFDEAALSVLWAIESAGSYSIAQVELIADSIRATPKQKLSPEAIAKEILSLILTGKSFNYIVNG